MIARAVARIRIVWVTALCVLALLPGCTAPASEEKAEQDSGVHFVPRRIVSLNPCLDAILREIAAPGQIAAISRYSQDSRATSVPLAWARRYPGLSESAEEVIAMRPDLVLASTYAARDTMLALRALGVPVLQFGAPDTVAASEGQIAAIAARIGRDEQGRRLIARIRRELKDAAPEPRSLMAGPEALVWQESGLVLGPNSLSGDMLARTGFRNAAVAMRIDQWGVIPLEDMLMHPPELLLTSRDMLDPGSGAGRMARLSHRALDRADAQIERADLPAQFLRCGGPSIIPAAQRLAAIRKGWEKGRLQ